MGNDIRLFEGRIGEKRERDEHKERKERSVGIIEKKEMEGRKQKWRVVKKKWEE